jgi:hypothetical protein
MFLRARHRIRLGLLVVGCLLFQHVAVAAYACELVASAPTPPAAAAHCAEMGPAPVAPESPALCAKHCTPDQTLLTDAAAPHVPALALPPAFALVLNAPALDSASLDAVPVRRSDPPPRLRYCSLLI